MAGLIDYTPRLHYLEADYLKSMLKMLPFGSIWRTVLGSIGSNPTPEERNSFVSLLSCFAAELARFEIRCMYLFQEKIPGLSVEMLEDWERVAGLPDVWQNAPTNDDERRAQAQAKLIPTSAQSMNDQYYIDYAAMLGFMIKFVQLDSSTVFRVGAGHMGDRIGGITATSGVAGMVTVQVIGGLEGTQYMQDVFEILKPGHVLLMWEALIFNRLIVFNIDTYDFAPVGIGDLASPVDTDSEVYAEDHANRLAQYGFKELTTVYLDSLETKRPTNISYCKGPNELLVSVGSFDYDWAFYSPMTTDVSIIARRLDTEDEFSLAIVFPASSEYFVGPHGIMSGCFDMGGSPVIAYELDVDSILIWRATEGATNFSGYSPLVVCNQYFVPELNPDNILFDTICLYLKDATSYAGDWNYDELTGLQYQIEHDDRASRTVYARFQHNNFDTEFTLCTTDFDIAYIENAWFDGDPDTYNPATDFGKEYVLHVSVRDTDKVRHTLKSANYFYTNSYPVNATDSTSMTAELTGGDLFETVAFAPMQVESVGMTAALESGVLLNMEAKYEATEGIGITAALSSGVLFDALVSAPTQTESTSLTAAISSGSNATVLIEDSQHTETTSMTAEIASGLLETV